MKISKEVFQGLDKFREERGLQNDCGNWRANILEEVVEYMRADTEHDKIDALCDAFVFAVNSIAVMGVKPGCFPVASVLIRNHPFVRDAVREMSFTGESVSANFSYLCFMMECSFSSIFNMGYDPNKCLLETCKEINSRKGAHDHSIGKWVKDKNQDPATLYKADYSKCKLEK